MKLIVILFVVLCSCYHVRADCAMRGECGVVNGFPVNCQYRGPPISLFNTTSELTDQIRDEIFSLALNTCPHLILDDEGNVKPDDEVLTCCDYEQLINMANSLLLAESVLGRCPTCVRNFARQICEMNCSPEQTRFVDVYVAMLDDGTEYIREIDYRMYEEFMEDSYTSCAGVLVPQTGMPAINIMCGDVPVCDAQNWYSFTGNVSVNPLTGTQVNFLKWPTAEDSMNARAPPCNESNYGDLPCSCIDCSQVCPVGTEPTLPEMCTVLNINCWAFSVSIVVIFISVVILIFLSTRDYKKTKKGMLDSKPPDAAKKRKINKTNKFFQLLFSKIGAFSANNSLLMITLTSWISFAMFFGVANLNITSNPLELWSAPDSRSRMELEYFNSRFGAFYRTSQVYLQFTGLEPFTVNNQTFGPAFTLEAVLELMRLEQAIVDIGRDDGGITIENVCFAPLRQRGGEQLLNQCASMSVGTYFGNNIDNINNNTYLASLQGCINNYLSFGCQAQWGGGAEPDLAIGGWDPDNILSADTLLLNFPLNNPELEEDLQTVLEWETNFIKLLENYKENKPDFVEVFYGTERSIEDEIQRVSALEAVPITISYIIMFIYVIVSLGNVRSCSTWCIDSKVMVAIGSIIIVLLAIFCGMGVMGYLGISVTLLAINVVPFFLLSVGIDNVFLMVNTLHDVESNLKDYEDYNENFSFNRKRSFIFGKMMGKVGSSMFVASCTQITCFGIGVLAKFPAVQTFAAFVSISLGFLFVFQITAIVAILSIDYKRSSQNRFDIFCCIQKKILNDSDPLNSDISRRSVIASVMGPYSKFLLKWWVKVIVALVFLTMLGASVMLIPKIEVGLDQEMALPKDSYVYAYLTAVRDLLRLGPPVFFVVKSGLNYSDPNHQNVICGGRLCYDDSLTTQIFMASQYSNVTYIARSSNSWIDDFFDWSSLYGACCKYNTTDGSFCRSVDTSPDCAYCQIPRAEWQNGLRPSGEGFENYIPFFLQDDPTDLCNRGGLASYAAYVNYVLDSEGRATVYDTGFMSYHKTVSTSYDYITAVKNGYEISENISLAIKNHTGLDIEVFPYSIFYVFYEQYLTMWEDTFYSILFCLIGAFVFNFVASGFNFLTTFAVMCTVVMVVLDMMGVMYLWNIPLNAVSNINLIVAIGISVEFCSHISYAYATSSSPREDRVADAVKAVGATIITGITFTNIPIVVLAFSHTEIIEVFFFRMLFSIVVLGFLHGMVFFPVLLSYLDSLKCKS